MQFGEGYVTYLAAIGLVCLGLYSIFKNDYEKGMTLIIAGIGVAGGRRAIDRVPDKVVDKTAVVVKALEEKECK